MEREIGAICRTKAVLYAKARDSDKAREYDPVVALSQLEDILGVEKYENELVTQVNSPGVVTGLVAYSGLSAGNILFIEVATMPGNGKVKMTGKLGEVLKESVEVALTWVRAHARELGLADSVEKDIMHGRDVHAHCPSGAIPKVSTNFPSTHLLMLRLMQSAMSASLPSKCFDCLAHISYHTPISCNHHKC